MNAVAEIETGLFLADLFLDLCEILRYPITTFLFIDLRKILYVTIS